MKRYTYIAIETTPPSIHVHCNRVKKGETYLVAKTDDPEFVSVTGNLYDKNGGMDRVYDKHLNIKHIKPYVKLK